MIFASVDEIIASGKWQPNSVEVFSRNDAMGKSVCALKDFKTDEIVATYGGRFFEDDENVPESDYLLSLKKGTVIDGNPSYPESAGHVGIFINDACGPINNGETNNVYFSVGWIETNQGKKSVVWIKAKRKILLGEEFYLSYGKLFWKTFIEKNQQM